MTHRAWSHPVHHWHVPHVRLPHLPRLAPGRAIAIRDGLIVLLCALLAAGLGLRVVDAVRGPLLPDSVDAART